MTGAPEYVTPDGYGVWFELSGLALLVRVQDEIDDVAPRPPGDPGTGIKEGGAPPRRPAPAPLSVITADEAALNVSTSPGAGWGRITLREPREASRWFPWLFPAVPPLEEQVRDAIEETLRQVRRDDARRASAATAAREASERVRALLRAAQEDGR